MKKRWITTTSKPTKIDGVTPDTPTPAAETLPWLKTPVLLGLSGGRDSVALLHLLLRCSTPVHACHVHHGIRGAEADGDAAFCRDLCADLGVPFHLHHIDCPALAAQSGQSLETAAREARRRYMAELARECGCKAIALAHHADDQAETVLFRLCRGAAGLRGMHAVHEAQGVVWLRPLLGCTRAQLTAWLQNMGQTWREDGTNAIPDVARNRIRLEAMPALSRALGREVAPIINRSARLQEETLTALEAALDLLPTKDPQGRLYLPFVLQQPLALRKAILHRYLVQSGVPDVNEAMVQAVEALLPPDSPVSMRSLPGGLRAARRHKRLVIEGQ